MVLLGNVLVHTHLQIIQVHLLVDQILLVHQYGQFMPQVDKMVLTVQMVLMVKMDKMVKMVKMEQQEQQDLRGLPVMMVQMHKTYH